MVLLLQDSTVRINPLKEVESGTLEQLDIFAKTPFTEIFWRFNSKKISDFKQEELTYTNMVTISAYTLRGIKDEF